MHTPSLTYRSCCLTAAVLLSTTSLAQNTRHAVEPGSKGNTITLEVINELPTPLTDLAVDVTTNPGWVKITGADVASVLAAGSTGEAVIDFDVLSSARSRDQGDIIITISSGGSLIAQKTIPLTVAPPTIYKLSQNYPNPFNPSTTIEYQLPVDGHVSLKVYDLLGREVATLVNEQQTADYYKIKFDVGDIASGVYFYRLDARPVAGGLGFRRVMRMMVLR
jgi:hypothetical protein